MRNALHPSTILLALFFFIASLPVFSQDKYRLALVGFYNFENLFDPIDSPDTDDAEFTPSGLNGWTKERYQEKLRKLSQVISEIGSDQSPDGLALLGVAEIENRGVLEDFARQEKVAARNYQIVHFDSPDPRGIDVALLYQAKYFQVTSSQTIPMASYASNGEVRGTRDILYVRGLFDGEPLHVLVNHWPSRSGGEKATQPLRNAAAMLCKKVIDSLQRIDPAVKVLVMGDLNDDPVSPSVKEVLNAKKSPAEAGIGAMFNPMYDYYKKGLGTLAYRDAWNLFDQILLSAGIADQKAQGYRFFQAKVFNPPYMCQTSGPFRGYPLRTFAGGEYLNGYSDHFPVFVSLVKKVN
ncbi:MAG: endonuclease/exonuclease/phosphatase family protein [Haliscomenobacter sp.]|nr:endonuclease/exonuclease/phosphatase family protein [Haliscomenobacter sp.]MBK7474557.1 endonuclease/exonuclease/phosphatase family protein [Haliscomenobacter sp.]